MRDLLPGLLERADLALAACEGVIDASSLAHLRAAVASVRARLSYPDDVAVVALAGGTGSGKSSVFNALIGEEASDVGGTRPTTDRPLAAIPDRHGEAMSGYLDRIGIERTLEYPGDQICLIDLPDTDSVEADHRHQVDALLAVVDLVVWVVDPQKYRDARLHDDYLKPMAPYSGQFLFALNQIDRLRSEEQTAILADLRSALVDEGIVDPVVMAVSANPPAGPPIGIEELHGAITERLAQEQVVYEKVLTDLEGAARSLAEAAGTGLDFDRRARDAVNEAAGDLIDGDEARAAGRLVALLDTVAAEADGSTGARIRSLSADVAGHIARIGSQVNPASPRRALWPFRRGRSTVDPASRAGTLIGEAVVRPARALLAKRALAIASVSELSLEVSRIRAR